MIIICCLVHERRWQRSAQQNSLLSYEGTKQHKVNQAAWKTGKTKFSRQNSFHNHEALPSLGVALPELGRDGWEALEGRAGVSACLCLDLRKAGQITPCLEKCVRVSVCLSFC